ncbi:MAG: MFS transporter [Proteobacteria bacterium]|nr:MFS transporter [Pseudomonadota bacterium]NDC23922.1 MFS transporter [Pseudomonadota bacterium]
MSSPKKSSLLRKNRVFRDFLSASTISLLGSNIFDIAIPVYVAQKTGSVFALSAATVALNLPFFLMAPFTGYLVDNFNKRKILLYSDVGQVICLALLLLYEFFSAQALWPMLVTVFAAKTLMIFFETVATFQLVPSLVSRSDLSEANAWFLSAQRFIQIVGPLLAGIMMTVAGINSCIILNIISFSATLYFVLKMKNLNQLLGEEHSKGHWRTITLGDIASNFTGSFRFIWNSPIFKPFVAMMFLWNLSSINPNHPTVTHYFTILKKFSPEQYGMILSLLGGLGIVGFVLSGSLYRKAGFLKTFAGGGLWLSIFATTSLFFFDEPILLGISLAISKMGSSVLSMGTFYLRQTHIPRSRMGGVNACLRMLFMSATPISCWIQPYLVEGLGSFSSFVFGALCLWATAGFAIQVAKKYRPEAIIPEDSKLAA